MSETKTNKKYKMTHVNYLTDGKEIEVKPVYDKNNKEVKGPIIIKGPEELEKEGDYIVIQTEPTRVREGR